MVAAGLRLNGDAWEVFSVGMQVPLGKLAGVSSSSLPLPKLRSAQSPGRDFTRAVALRERSCIIIAPPQVSALLSELVLYLIVLTWQPQLSLQQAPKDTLTPHHVGGTGVFQLL